MFSPIRSIRIPRACWPARPRLDMKMKVLPVVSDFMKTDETGAIVGVQQKYASVGEAILMNFIDEDEVREKRNPHEATTFAAGKRAESYGFR